jgi:hypothetical protein
LNVQAFAGAQAALDDVRNWIGEQLLSPPFVSI